MREAKQLPRIETLLFFGSFDPITLGHQALIQTALELLEPSEILIIPAFREGWGKRLSSFDNREQMIDLVIKSNPGWGRVVSVSGVEKNHQLSGITADTLHFLLDHGLAGKQLGLLMGADWIVSLPTWEEWDWMLMVAPAFVALRGEETRTTLLQRLTPEAQSYLGKKIFILPEEKTAPTKHVSSTRVRAEAKQGAKTELVDPQVRDFMERQALYLTS